MATSGSISYNENMAQIIGDAYALINVFQPDEPIPNSDYQYAVRQLNRMVKHWQTQDIHIWTKSEATLFLTLNQGEYTFPGARATESYVETELSADEASGQTTLSVTSSSGMTVNDQIGILLDSGALFWSTISAIPNSTSVTIASALTGDAASGNVVYSYTTAINRPLRILSGRRNSDNEQDTPLFYYAYQDYQNLPNKTTAQGPTTTISYKPLRVTGILYLWPVPTDLTDKIKFTYIRALEDMEAALNEPDFPTEWLMPISMQLAVLLSHRVGRRANIDRLKMEADLALEAVKSYDNEPASLYFQPAMY